jgi:hypothetical protein
MDRRDFVKSALAAGAASFVPGLRQNFRTRHFIWIVNGNGSRKADWYENAGLCPNLSRMAREGFVYEESYNDTVSRHDNSWAELITGIPVRDARSLSPTLMQHVRNTYEDRASNYWLLNGSCDLLKASSSTGQLTTDESRHVQGFLEATCGERDRDGLTLVPQILRAFKPRILVFHQSDHDVAHGNGGYPREESGYSEYLQVCKTTDDQIGKIFDFVKSDPYFSRNTTILVRPEFGRDDEVTRYGELHHSTGFYQAHHSAEIWWGPDIRIGVSRSLKNRLDVAPTIAGMFNVSIPDGLGQVRADLFKNPL